MSQKFKKSQIIFNCLKNRTLTESTLIPTQKKLFRVKESYIYIYI